MIVIQEAALEAARNRGSCEWCWARPPRLQAAHIYSRGAGEVTVSWNLAGLCFRCHHANHNGAAPTPDDLLEIAARREGVSKDAIWAAVQCVRRIPKRPREDEIEHHLTGLPIAARRLVIEAIKEPT